MPLWDNWDFLNLMHICFCQIWSMLSHFVQIAKIHTTTQMTDNRWICKCCSGVDFWLKTLCMGVRCRTVTQELSEDVNPIQMHHSAQWPTLLYFQKPQGEQYGVKSSYIWRNHRCEQSTWKWWWWCKDLLKQTVCVCYSPPPTPVCLGNLGRSEALSCNGWGMDYFDQFLYNNRKTVVCTCICNTQN